jgi:hypothetical protein
VASLVFLRLTAARDLFDIAFVPLNELVHLCTKDTPFGNMPFSAANATSVSRIVARWESFSLLWAPLV